MPTTLTPLRYPGGKTRLLEFFRELLISNELVGCAYVEPFAGGAGVAIGLLRQEFVSDVYINDINPGIYSFWNTVKSDPDYLCRRIRNVRVTMNVRSRQKRVLANWQEHEEREVAFATLFLNRVNRSGILDGGAIGGTNQSGKWKIDARFTRKTLTDKIEKLARLAHRVHVYGTDAVKFLRSVSRKLSKDDVVYLDPPYFNRARDLYLDFFQLDDHRRLAEFIKELPQNWVVTYDLDDRACDLYTNCTQYSYALRYSANRPSTGMELLAAKPALELPTYALPGSQTECLSNATIRR